MSKQIKRKEFNEILRLPGLKLIPVQFTFTQYLAPMQLFVLDPGDVEKPQPIQLADVYQCQSGLFCREAFTDFHAERRFEYDVAVITLRVGGA
jgi:hypothetical protein